jgi:hypothetical protein
MLTAANARTKRIGKRHDLDLAAPHRLGRICQATAQVAGCQAHWPRWQRAQAADLSLPPLGLSPLCGRLFRGMDATKKPR